MIIVKAKGSLGNQMFQYAMARVLSKKLSINFKIDIRDLEKRSSNGYEIERVFKLENTIAKSTEIKSILGFASNKNLYKLINKIKWFSLIDNIIFEENLSNYKNLYKNKEKFYLDGYWQSLTYFSEEIKLIKNDFTFRNILTGLNSELKYKIINTNSVCIHVRRGDYLNKNNNINKITSIDYYNNAINIVEKKLNNPHFYIFSDDINWARINIKSEFKTYYIDNNKNRNNFFDMQLMTYCKHHIIANSTFSWWGCILSKNYCGIKIAPKYWFNDINKNINIFDDNWILV